MNDRQNDPIAKLEVGADNMLVTDRYAKWNPNDATGRWSLHLLQTIEMARESTEPDECKRRPKSAAPGGRKVRRLVEV